MRPPSGDGSGAAGTDGTPAGRNELTRLGEAFGDPTRRDLYRRVTVAATPPSAGELALASGLHRTVVRTHLERLVELGLLDVSLRRTGRGGRPAKLYSPGTPLVDVTIPRRRYRSLAMGLLAVLPAVAADEQALIAAVEDAGLRDGLAAGAASVEEALVWLNANGYRAVVADRDGRRVLELGNCVFAELARDPPGVVCGYDRALLCGLLGVPLEELRQVESMAAGDRVCRLPLPSRL